MLHTRFKAEILRVLKLNFAKTHFKTLKIFRLFENLIWTTLKPDGPALQELRDRVSQVMASNTAIRIVPALDDGT